MIQVTKDKSFHLMTENTSYIIKVLPTRHVGTLYYGKRIREKENYDNLFQSFSIYGGIETQYDGQKAPYSLNQVCLEFSSYGKSDFREPSVHMTFEDGSRVTDVTYLDHEIQDGKESLCGMPGFFGNKDKVQTLKLKLHDQVKQVEVLLVYNVFPEANVITRRMEITNVGNVINAGNMVRVDPTDGSDGSIRIEKAMSMNMDFPHDRFELLSLNGHWIREKHIERQKIRKGIMTISSKRLSSSAMHNPFIALVDPKATENKGGCYGYALVYSGNHEMNVEVTTHNLTRVQLGINSFDFSWLLKKGDTFVTPEVVMTFSDSGLNGMSQNFHQAIRKHLISPEWQGKEKPILFNSWEAMYFDFNERKLMTLIKAGKKLGMELFVLDDGWFKGRNDDTTSLGDWIVDRKKLPNGLRGLGEKVRGEGLDFGLWVEPEMVSVKSDLYREHPDWAIKLPDREPSFGRNQLILDMSNPDVVDYLFDALSKAFNEAGVSYVKWDMNRNGTDLYSNHLSAERQGELAHRYYLGLYELLHRLKEAFPKVLFESCASGGNRHDLGMLFYMPQTWASDNTDPGERMHIQYGASLLFPQETIGAHIGSNPSHQVMRDNDLETRFNMAAFGSLGYELKLTDLSTFEKKTIMKQVSFYKEHRKALQQGKFYRIRSPFEGNYCSWMVVGDEKAYLGDYQKIQESYPGFDQIALVGLNEQDKYKLSTREHFINVEVFGDLINHQLPVNIKTTGMQGLVHKTITEKYLFEGEKQEVIAYGDELMYAGFRPYPQFIGLGYDERTRLMRDFGSRMYLIEKVR